jgi:hypothetical protein
MSLPGRFLTGLHFVDTLLQDAFRLHFEDAQGFSHGAAAVKKQGLWGFIDRKGNWLQVPAFTKADSYQVWPGIGIAAKVSSGESTWLLSMDQKRSPYLFP